MHKKKITAAEAGSLGGFTAAANMTAAQRRERAKKASDAAAEARRSKAQRTEI